MLHESKFKCDNNRLWQTLEAIVIDCSVENRRLSGVMMQLNSSLSKMKLIVRYPPFLDVLLARRDFIGGLLCSQRLCNGDNDPIKEDFSKSAAIKRVDHVAPIMFLSHSYLR